MLAYAQVGEDLWPAIAEKARAWRAGGYHELLGIIGNSDAQWPAAVLRALTGAPVSSRHVQRLADLAAAFADGHVVTCDGPSPDGTTHHLIAVIGVDAGAGEVRLYDPNAAGRREPAHARCAQASAQAS